MKIKITVSKNELLAKLKAVSKVIKPSNIIPDHNSFLFEIDDYLTLKVTGADEMGNITAKVDCAISEECELSFLIDAKLLLDGLRELPEQPIILEIDIETYAVNLIHQSGTYHFTGRNSEHFSKVEVNDPEMTTIKMDAELLIAGIKKVYHFAGNDEIRPMLSSVFIESKMDKLTFASSNASTMAAYECRTVLSPFEFDLILPVKIAKIIAELLHGEDTIQLLITEKSVAVKTDSKAINYRLIEGTYPNFRAVIPKGNDKIVNCSTNEIVSALRRTSIFANSNSRLIILQAKNSMLEISGKDMDLQNSAVEKIAVSYTNEPIQIGFKSDYLSKCLETIDTEEVSLSFSEPSKACLITPVGETDGKLTVLIMPMLVNI
ncbi:MAG TPA: DNA polymerase III subunit beta [Prolixibacteraceae bacterium]|nr:DNA polymerase III subunit beta [Prolixibacteraceae bacterium]